MEASAVTLYDEINALGGVADPNDERSIGRMENLDEVLAILERHGLANISTTEDRT